MRRPGLRRVGRMLDPVHGRVLQVGTGLSSAVPVQVGPGHVVAIDPRRENVLRPARAGVLEPVHLTPAAAGRITLLAGDHVVTAVPVHISDGQHRAARRLVPGRSSAASSPGCGTRRDSCRRPRPRPACRHRQCRRHCSLGHLPVLAERDAVTDERRSPATTAARDHRRRLHRTGARRARAVDRRNAHADRPTDIRSPQRIDRARADDDVAAVTRDVSAVAAATVTTLPLEEETRGRPRPGAAARTQRLPLLRCPRDRRQRRINRRPVSSRRARTLSQTEQTDPSNDRRNPRLMRHHHARPALHPQTATSINPRESRA